MLRTFNVGMGMLVMVSRGDLETTKSLLADAGEKPIVIGEIVTGDREVVYEGTL